jgi:archaemetzincin
MIGVYQVETLSLYPAVHDAVMKHLRLETEYAGTFAVPSNAYNPLRQQYDARTIVDALMEQNSKQYEFGIGFVDVDIYVSKMNYIFGLADPVKKAALVSMFRLAGERCEERVAKETVHELGHLRGLQHCTEGTCVMHFSNTLEDTDQKEATLCSVCRSHLE